MSSNIRTPPQAHSFFIGHSNGAKSDEGAYCSRFYTPRREWWSRWWFTDTFVEMEMDMYIRRFEHLMMLVHRAERLSEASMLITSSYGGNPVTDSHLLPPWLESKDNQDAWKQSLPDRETGIVSGIWNIAREIFVARPSCYPILHLPVVIIESRPRIDELMALVRHQRSWNRLRGG